MVDSLSSLSSRPLLHTPAQAQEQRTSAAIVALKSNAKATQAVIDQLQQTVDQGKVMMRQTIANAGAPSANLPRGSLVDILA